MYLLDIYRLSMYILLFKFGEKEKSESKLKKKLALMPPLCSKTFIVL